MTIYLLIIGLLGSSTLAILGYFFNAISFNGIFTTIIIGTTITVAGNFPTWSSIVFLFGSSLFFQITKKVFFSSSLKHEEYRHEKKGPRDTIQILANTLPATLCLLLHFITEQHIFLLAYLASFAGATADTWGSEIGVLSKKNPIDIITLKKTPPGISGGISFLGTLFSFLGSLSSIIVFLFFTLFSNLSLTLTESIYLVLIGFSTSIIDSVLGSLFQGIYLNTDDELTEQAQNNHLTRGFSWMNNDLVNLLTNSISALLAFLILK